MTKQNFAWFKKCPDHTRHPARAEATAPSAADARDVVMCVNAKFCKIFGDIASAFEAVNGASHNLGSGTHGDGGP